MGRIAESLMEEVKEPEWLLTSEPSLADLSRSLTRRKCPVACTPSPVKESILHDCNDIRMSC